VTIEGGTHLPQSPFADYLLQIWNPVLREMDIVAEPRTVRTGWYPIGGGRIEACIRGTKAGADERFFRPLAMNERGPIRRIYGRSIAANLPQHIVERMAARAQALLADRGIEAHVERACETAECPGAALFLGAEFDHGLGGVCALGRRGKPAEQVASEAVEGLLGYLDSGVALDAHLGDQVLVPAALATGRSCFTVEHVSPHLTANAWVIERFGCAQIMIQQRDDGTALVTVDPIH
jgi:RNA 3'-terminal phosphate cyclase (ATP)